MQDESSVETLVARARAGDPVAWDAIVDRFLPLVTAIINRHRLRPADAADVNQTLWLRLVEHLDELREPRALPGWISTTTRFECLAVIRRNQRTTPVDPTGYTALDGELDAGDRTEIDDDLLGAERRQALRDGLAALSEDRRALLMLLILTDPPPSYAEVSARLGIPIGSIGPTRARAIADLQNTPAMRALIAAGTLDQSGAGR